jgi:hypothetical protein
LEDIEIDNNTLQEVSSDNIALNDSSNRHADMSESEIDQVAQKRLSAATEQQTKWAVKLLKGEYLKKNSLFIELIVHLFNIIMLHVNRYFFILIDTFLT